MPLTPETWRSQFQNNVVNSDSHTQPKITQLTNGNILVVWTNSADPASGPGSAPASDIIGRLYDSQGNAIGGEIELNPSFRADIEILPDVTALADGGFAVVYNSLRVGTGYAEWDIHLEEFNANGTQRSAATIFNDDTTGSDFYQFAKIAQATATSTMVAYTKNGDDLVFKIYNPSTNSLGSEITVWPGGTTSGEGVDQDGHDVVGLTNGTYMISWVDKDSGASDNDDVYLARFSSSGTQFGGDILVDNSLEDAFDTSITQLSNGNVVVSWTTDGSGGSNSGIRFRIYDSGGVAQTATLSPLVNGGTTAGNQSKSKVVAIDNGEFLVIWVDESTFDIHARHISATGATLGSEYDVINYGASTIKSIDAVALEDGRVAVSWNGDISNSSDRIYTEILDTRDFANTTPAYTDDQVVGTIGNDVINPVPAGTDKIFAHNGNDLVWFNFTNEFSVDYNGGTGTDILGMLNASTQSYNFLQSVIDSVEVLQFNNGGLTGQTRAFFNANEFTSFNTIDFAQNDAKTDFLEIRMNTLTVVNYSGLTLTDYDADEVTIRIIGDSSVENITGTSGNDLINGGGGDDILDGGAGFDTFDMNSSGYTGNTTVNLASETIVSNIGTEDIRNFENVEGAGTNDSITGTLQSNIIRGNGGNDVITGSEGRDESYGGSGNDRIIMTEDWLNNGVEIMDGGSGTDTLVLQDLSTGTQVIQFTNDTITSFEELEFGGSRIVGDVDLIAVFTAAQFNGNGVSLTAVIDGFNNTGDTETLRINMGSETTLDLSGLTFVDWGQQGEIVDINGGSSSETITGTSQRDDISTAGGNDRLDGGGGDDILRGGNGNDVYVVDSAGDQISGEIAFSSGGGIDTVESFVNWTLGNNLEILRLQGSGNINGEGNGGPNALVGQGGSNILRGGGGDDAITAKGGNDVLVGGGGADQLVGDAGADRFDYNSLSDTYAGSVNRDFINGFTNGVDVIDLSDIDANPFNAGDQAFNWIGNAAFSGSGAASAGQARFFTFGGGNFNIVELDWNGDGTAESQIFVNLTNSMTAGDFIF